MLNEYAVSDTCFLIDWVRYRRRDILFKLFKAVFIPEEVLNEVKSEDTISWIANELSKDHLVLYTSVRDEVEEARELIELSRSIPQLPSLELPEALCLVIGRRRGYVVLTENRAALLVPKFISKYKDVKVWRSLEVVLNAVINGVLTINCDDVYSVFREYSEDTFHLFPSKALKDAIREVSRLCLGRN